MTFTAVGDSDLPETSPHFETSCQVSYYQVLLQGMLLLSIIAPLRAGANWSRTHGGVNLLS